MKIWYCLCILFFVNCIISLLNDSYETTYVSDEESDLKSSLNFTEFLFCLKIQNHSFKNISVFEIERILYNKLKDYLKSPILKKILVQLFNEIKKFIIYNNMICLKVFNGKELAIYKMSFPDLFKQFYTYNNVTYDFFSIEIKNVVLKNFLSKFHQIIFLNREYPYSNCLNNYTKFICLNNCFIKKNRLIKYYYEKDKTNLIHAENEINASKIQDDENACSKKCKKDSCKSIYLVLKNFNHYQSVAFKAIVLMSTFDFRSQLIGLICLFINISFYQIYMKLTSIAILKAERKIKKIKKLRKIIRLMFTFRFFLILFISFILSLILLYVVIVDYKEKGLIKKETTSFLIVLEPLILVICIPFPNGFGYKTALELEKESNVFLENLLESVYLAVQNKHEIINWHLDSKVYFKSNGLALFRCFKITTTFKDVAKYQILFLNAKLVIELKDTQPKKYDYELYILAENQNFTSNSYKHDPKNEFLKIIEKKSIFNKEDNCTYYRSKYFHCYSKFNCIDHCIQKMFFERSQNLPSDSIIDKEFFTEKQWSVAYINNDKELYKIVNENCSKIFKNSDCESTIFENSVPNTFSLDQKHLRIDLNYAILSLLEEEPYWYKLVLDILNLQSILFGMNFLKMSFLIFNFLKFKFKLKNNKFVSYFIYILCGLGFFLHSYFLFTNVVNGELVSSQFFEFSNEFVAPYFVFCIDIKKSLIDENNILKGEYLDEVTSAVKKESLFEKIDYLNENNEWISLNKTTKFRNPKFKIDIFYFLYQKCFKIKQKITYSKENFYFNDDEDTILKIHFNRALLYEYKDMYFYTTIRGTKQFSKPIALTYKNITENSKTLHSINQELYEISYKDKFNLIKNPLSFFSNENNNLNDVDNYLKGLNKTYREYLKYKTLSLPLDSDDFSEIIDDELFDQFYYQVKNVSDHKAASDSNYQRLFSLNLHSNFSTEINKPSFTFNIKFFKKTLVITNEDNYVKLVINLLNILSLWLDHSVLDLYAYVYKAVTYLNYPYICLLKIQNILIQAISR